MAENSKIEWTDHTFNPWIGCTKVGPGCDNCYAEHLMDTRLHRVEWGPAGERSRTSPAYWRKPLAWNRAAEGGPRPRVFCASLADVFDSAVPQQWREDLFDLIRETPNLDWLLLTKRISNVNRMLPHWWGYGWPNVWIGATVVTQREAERDIPRLARIPAQVRFLSCEPLIERISLQRIDCRGVHWIIVGGESGPNARPLDPDWCQLLRCEAAEKRMAFFMKQGSQANWPDWKDFGAWRSTIQVREFPVERGQKHG